MPSANHPRGSAPSPPRRGKRRSQPSPPPRRRAEARRRWWGSGPPQPRRSPLAAPTAPPEPPTVLVPPLPPSPAELRERQRQRRLHVVPDAAPVPRPAPKPPSRPTFLAVFLLYTTRLVIASIGLGAIAGTLIAAFDSTRRATQEAPRPRAETAAAPAASQYPPALPARQELIPLKTQLALLFEQTPQYEPGVFLLDLDTGAYLDWQANRTFPAASTIKTPILVAFFQAVDAGEIRLNELLTLTPEAIVGEAGDMQYQPPGTEFTVLETAVKMIAISDNTATNLLIERLGGMEALNQKFAAWGLGATRLHSPLPDLEGTNTTSPLDLAHLLAAVHRGELLSLPSRDRLLSILRQVEHDDLLPQGLEEGAIIAHKTGRIRTVLADAGLIDTPTGKRYLAAVIVQRPPGDERAANLIQEISRLAYQQFNQAQPAPTATTDSIEAKDSVATKDEEP